MRLGDIYLGLRDAEDLAKSDPMVIWGGEMEGVQKDIQIEINRQKIPKQANKDLKNVPNEIRTLSKVLEKTSFRVTGAAPALAMLVLMPTIAKVLLGNMVAD